MLTPNLNPPSTNATCQQEKAEKNGRRALNGSSNLAIAARPGDNGPLRGGLDVVNKA